MSEPNEFSGLPVEVLKRAVELREKIEELTRELNSILGMADPPRKIVLDGIRVARRKHQLSAAGRARIAAAQKERWEKYKASNPAKTKDSGRSTRLSEKGRARVSAAMKARWERYRAAKAMGLNPRR